MCEYDHGPAIELQLYLMYASELVDTVQKLNVSTLQCVPNSRLQEWLLEGKGTRKPLKTSQRNGKRGALELLLLAMLLSFECVYQAVVQSQDKGFIPSLYFYTCA